jgi:hypothetical protein
MLLFNATAVPARIRVNAGEPGQPGIGVLTAKATFRFDRRGRVALDTQAPWPLFERDHATPLGVLPGERVACRGRRFEVMLLGHAYAERGQSARELEVSLSVGKEHRALWVSGDRTWVRRFGRSPVFTAPLPFERMPLTYERAFGGTATVELDAASKLDVSHPLNPRGRGFDASAFLDGLEAWLGAPRGYPRLTDDSRALPNVEHPEARITCWDDAPEPAGFAPGAPDIAVQHLARVRRGVAENAETSSPTDPDELFYRAHSDLVIDLPPAGAHVRLQNLCADQGVIEFALPELSVIADYIVYGRQGQRELRPYALVLSPDESGFYICYGAAFSFEPGPARERAFRLRLASGWYDSA